MPLSIYNYYEGQRTSYYEQLIFPTSFENFNEVLHHTKDHYLSFKSALPVKFKVIDFGDSRETVVSKMGKPRFVCENTDFSPLVFFYKENLLKHKLLIQLHFFDKKFVMATQSIIDTDLKWRESVKTIILEKYYGFDKMLINTGISENEKKNLRFADEENNKILFMEGINLNIIYCSGNDKHMRLIEDFNDLKIKKLNDDQNNIKTILKNAF